MTRGTWALVAVLVTVAVVLGYSALRAAGDADDLMADLERAERLAYAKRVR